MITEHALLDVVAGERGRVPRRRWSGRKGIIAASPGFVSLAGGALRRAPEPFLLLVEWERLEDHTEGFRGSQAYEEWRAALHHFYDPFPVVEHFEPVVRA